MPVVIGQSYTEYEIMVAIYYILWLHNHAYLGRNKKGNDMSTSPRFSDKFAKKPKCAVFAFLN